MKRLLCATDFSDGSAAALEFAVFLAQPFQAEIRIVHVCPGPVPSGSPMACLVHGPSIEDKSSAELTQHLDRCQQAARIAGLATQSVLLQGDPPDEIVREGMRTSADFMVMGRHGHGASNPWTLGSVVERVLRRAPCPVVVVRPLPRHRGQGPGHVLCGLDLGETSASTLKYAVGIAKALEADLQVLHVAAEEGAERARSDLAATVARASTAKAPRVQRSVVTGEPHEQILGRAGQNDIGLIVVGSHGGVVVDRPFLGSTVLHLLRHADCPVLVVPAHLTETREQLVASRPGERDADSRHRR